MEEQDPLLEYVGRVKDLCEFLARGNEFETEDGTIVKFNGKAALRDGVISIEEIELFDVLETTGYNELGSITALMEIINEYDWETLKKHIEPYISKPLKRKQISPIFAETYKTIKNRTKELLNKMVLQLYMGLKVEISEMDLTVIQLLEEMDDDQYEDEEEEFEDMGNLLEIQMLDDMESDEYDEYDKYDENDMNSRKLYIVYSYNQKKFYAMRGKEIVLENVDVPTAMLKTANYLYCCDKEKKIRELQGKKEIGNMPEYDGMHINIDGQHEGTSGKDHGEL